ncbi:MAG TPA: hypothetical protein VGR78_13175 [Verrucomicrobiae bacterium]|nr:hypothetical protein [Verrucomicrobiae bacterium]
MQRKSSTKLRGLGPEEQKHVVEFVHALEYDDWDREIVADDSAGRLDFLKEQARKAVRTKRLEPLP